MAEQGTFLAEPEAELDEFYITPALEQDDNAFFVTGTQKPGEIYVQTSDENVYRISVGKEDEDITVEAGDIIRDGFAPKQDPLTIARGGLVTILGQPRSRRSKQAAVEEFDVSASDSALSIFSEQQPIRVIAPAGYFRIPPPEDKQ